MGNYRSSNSSSCAKKPLGQILIEAGLVTVYQIELALEEQKQSGLRIGEILVLHNWIKQETVDFFAERWSKILEEKTKQPLIYYFHESGLLDTIQINAIVRSQKLDNDKVKFHHLAVKEGLLKQITVDFFLSHIFNIYNPNNISFTKTHDVLKKYFKGDKNFSRIDLSKAPLSGISLKNITLNGSNLSKADLSKANLSFSNLIQVNLSMANLTKAILTEANLTRSFLTRANFQEAHLAKANFKFAILHEVNFQLAYLAQVNFSGADLTNTKLPLDYPYRVYYDQHTIFDHNFDPKLFGWVNLDHG
ncbi:MAG: pentapeptide repeat-containing protein [Cyanobacteria bacterium P01_F01_bin.143]